MSEKLSRWDKFKRFLKRNMTPLWAKRFTYQVFAFLVSVAMVVGVAVYAFTKSYDDKELTFVDGFTITAHAGAYDTVDNSLETVQLAMDNNDDVVEIDVRRRPDGTVVMGHDIITTNNDGVELTAVFDLASDSDIRFNLDIKDIKCLSELYKLIIRYEMGNRVFLTGIETYQADTAAEECPGIDYYINYIPSRVNIFSEDYQQKIIELLEKTGAIGINCNHAYASRTLSKLLHEHGYKLSIWTCDRYFQIKRGLINKPDNITTNRPDKVREIIEEWGK